MSSGLHTMSSRSSTPSAWPTPCTGLDVEFDLYRLSPDEMRRRVTDAGFTPVFWGGCPAYGPEAYAQEYLLARKS